MYNYIAIILFLIVTNIQLLAQNADGKRNLIDIQEITINDYFLTNEIHKYVNELISTDSLFKLGYGYLKLTEIAPHDSGAYAAYHIFPSLVSLGENHLSHAPFYSYVNERIILIDLGLRSNVFGMKYRKQSMKKLNKQLEKFLLPSEKVVAMDMDGNKVFKDNNFRQEYFYGHGAGRVITYYLDGTVNIRQATYKD
jgi:hypothetical protein